MKKQPKPKSVDECWMIEVKPGKFYIPVIIRKTKKSAETRKRGEIFPSRIRKWRAETVCEWRDNECGWISRQCKPGILSTSLRKEKFCGNCGGKIRVKR